MALWIDGSTPDGLYYGYTKNYSDQPPYAVFDDESQSDVYVSRWLWLVRLRKWWLNGGLSLP